ncbi:MAG: hypothetical protein FIA97_06995 [Methylococcaceae bacterium]|nr:hypothetical protein [Methylococcaceae bacterium]
MPPSKVLAVSMFLLSGCGASLPDCDDPGVREDVSGLVEEQFENDLSLAVSGGAVVAELTHIRTSEVLENGAKKCVATVTLVPSSESPKLPAVTTKEITYQITQSQDGLSRAISLDWP